THHAPIPGRGYRLAPHYPGTRLSDEGVLTAAYRSDLTELMWPGPVGNGFDVRRPADLWIFGHTHESEDVPIGQTRSCPTPRAMDPGCRSIAAGTIHASIPASSSKSEGGSHDRQPHPIEIDRRRAGLSGLVGGDVFSRKAAKGRQRSIRFRQDRNSDSGKRS